MKNNLLIVSILLLGMACNEIEQKQVLPAASSGFSGDYRGQFFSNNSYNDETEDMHIYNSSTDPNQIVIGDLYHLSGTVTPLGLRAFATINTAGGARKFAGTGKPVENTFFNFGGGVADTVSRDSIQIEIAGEIFKHSSGRDSISIKAILNIDFKLFKDNEVDKDTIYYYGFRLTGFPELDK